MSLRQLKKHVGLLKCCYQLEVAKTINLALKWKQINHAINRHHSL